MDQIKRIKREIWDLEDKRKNVEKDIEDLMGKKKTNIYTIVLGVLILVIGTCISIPVDLGILSIPWADDFALLFNESSYISTTNTTITTPSPEVKSIPKHGTNKSTFYGYNSSGNLTMDISEFKTKNVPLETKECCPIEDDNSKYLVANEGPAIFSQDIHSNNTKYKNGTKYAPLGDADIKFSVINTSKDISFIVIPSKNETLNTTIENIHHEYSNTKPNKFVFEVIGLLLSLLGAFIIIFGSLDYKIKREVKYERKNSNDISSNSGDRNRSNKSQDNSLSKQIANLLMFWKTNNNSLIDGQLDCAAKRISTIEKDIKDLENKKKDILNQQISKSRVQGRVIDNNQPVEGARVELRKMNEGNETLIGTTRSLENGSFSIKVPLDTCFIRIKNDGQSNQITINASINEVIDIGDVVLQNQNSG